MTVVVKHKAERTHRVSVKEWRAISAEAWRTAGEVWHRRILPKHFTRRGAAEYGYERRSRRHQKRKLKKYGHNRPLEFTGDLKRQVLRMRDVRVVGDNSRRQGAAVIKLRGPRYLHQYRKDLNQPDKAAELRTVSERDAQVLARAMERVITQRMNGAGRREDLK